jgi:hypothetical protein
MAFATAVVIFAGMYIVPTSYAATVEVVDTPGESNHSELNLRDDAAENNSLTVSITGKAGAERLQLSILDTASNLTAGPGCQGGGMAGMAVICSIHELAGPKQEICGRDCVHDVPGTAWIPSVHLRLGDGENSLRTTGFTALGVPALSITTGSGSDRIKTTGEDATVFASPIPGGKDVYNLGGYEDEVSYADRAVPVSLRDSTVTSGSETDRLEGVEFIAGSSGADTLRDGARGDHLGGGPGDDRPSEWGARTNWPGARAPMSSTPEPATTRSKNSALEKKKTSRTTPGMTSSSAKEATTGSRRGRATT